MDSTITNETPEIKLHFLDYWRVIRMRLSLILTVFLLVVLTTTGMTFWLLPKQYESVVRMDVQKDIPDVSLDSRQMAYYQTVDPYFLQTQFRIIESSRILHGVVTNLHLDQVFAQQMGEDRLTLDECFEILTKGSKRVRVQQYRNTSLIEISVRNPDRQLAADIANSVADIYKQYRLELWTTSRESGLKALKEQLAKTESELQAANEKLSKLRQELRVPEIDGNPVSSETVYTDKLRLLAKSRTEAEVELAHYSEILAGILKLSKEELKTALNAALPIPDIELSDLSIRMAKAEENFVAVKEAELGPKNPKYKEAEAQLATAEQQLNAKIKGIINGLKTRVTSIERHLEKIKSLEDAANDQASEKAREHLPYFIERRKLESATRSKELLMARLNELEVESQQPLSTIVRITDIARPAEKPASPNVILNLILGVMVGLIVGIGLAFFIEYLDTSVKTIDDVERTLQAPVLGVIPQNVGLVMDEGIDSPHSEAYRVLQTNLLFARKDPSWNTLSVLSGGAGEGKSTTLFNLACVYAQGGSRVLVVDSDLRRPSVHKMLRVSNSIGLTNYLLGKNSLEEVIQKTKVPNLDFIASGKLPSSSLSLLSSQQMKELIQELKQRYDYVFFDSPPMLGVSDASILASEMDMVLQVVQYRRYPQPMTIRAKQNISKVGGNLMGIVLNNINMSQDENYYYYSGYYEYQTKRNEGTVVKLPDTAESANAESGIKQKY